ncbi:uncharacterized protein SCHCODRAFT_02519083 [Schizophyllum commune H4-8]|nr:uncharacterized protein SCHCODRAFT_02519083 [Schizophyllum commune H4-8]KAI5886037.1 hypothetical protein SCHCODRAFT_02519083 [Schizophyllum commune H4-8]
MDVHFLLLLYALLLQHYTMLVADLSALLPLLAHPIDLFDALADSFLFITTTLIRQLLATALTGRGPHRLACRLIVVFALTVTSAVATTLCGFAWLSRWAWGALCALVGIPGMAGLGISEVVSFLTTDHVLAEGLLHYLTIVTARSARRAPPPPTRAPWTSNSSEADATTFGSHADAAARAAPVTPEPRYTSVVDEWRHAVYTDEDFQEDDAVSTSATTSSDTPVYSDFQTSSLALVLYNGSMRSSASTAAGHALVSASGSSMPTTPFRRAQQSITAPAPTRLCEPVSRLLLTPSPAHAEDYDDETFFAASDNSPSSSQSSSPSSLFDTGRSLTPFTMLTSPDWSPVKPFVKKISTSVACQTDDLSKPAQLDTAEPAESNTVEKPRPAVVTKETHSTEPRAEQTERCGSLLFCGLTSAQIESLLVRSKPIQPGESNDVAIEIRVDVETVVDIEETCPALKMVDLGIATEFNMPDAPEAVSPVSATNSPASNPLPSIAPPSIIITPPSPGEQRAKEVVNVQDEQVMDGSKEASATAEVFAAVPLPNVTVCDDSHASNIPEKPASSNVPELRPSPEVSIPIPSPIPSTKATPSQSLDSDGTYTLANVRLPALEEQHLNKGFDRLSIADDGYPTPKRVEKYPLAAPTLSPRYCTPGRYVPTHALMLTFAPIPAESMTEVEVTETVELMVTEPITTTAPNIAALPQVLADVDVVMVASLNPIVQQATQTPDQDMALIQSPLKFSSINLPLQPHALTTTMKPSKSGQPTMSQIYYPGSTSIASASKGKAVDPAERPHALQGDPPHANLANSRRCATQQNAQQPSASQVWSEHMRVAAQCAVSKSKLSSPSRVDRRDDTPRLKTGPIIVGASVSRPSKRRAESMDRADADVDVVEEGRRRRQFRSEPSLPSLPTKAVSSHPMRTRSKRRDPRRDAVEGAWQRRVSHVQELQQVPWPKRALPRAMSARAEETSAETIVNPLVAPAVLVTNTKTLSRRDDIRRARALAEPTPEAPRKRRANRMEIEDERPQKRLRFVPLPEESAKASRPQKALRRHRREPSPSASNKQITNGVSQPPTEAQERPSVSTQRLADKHSQPAKSTSSRASELAARHRISVHELLKPSECQAGKKRTARDAGLPTMSREKASAAANAIENEILNALLEELSAAVSSAGFVGCALLAIAVDLRTVLDVSSAVASSCIVNTHAAVNVCPRPFFPSSLELFL